MNAINDPLWLRLRDFAFDHPGDALTFTCRLARENRWSPEFARCVVDEYRRFLFLALRAGHAVTPSDEVDQAWHLHLVYTRSYWEDLCQGVLGRALHHGPTRGGRVEDDRFERQYADTQASYTRWFGQEPPADIWPPAEIRFAPQARFARVDLAAFWMLPKLRIRRAAAACLLAVIPLVTLVACGTTVASVTISSSIPILLVLLCLFLVIKAAKRGGGGKGDGSGCGASCGGGGAAGCSGSGHHSDGGSHSGCSSDGGSSGCSSGCGGGGCGGGGD